MWLTVVVRSTGRAGARNSGRDNGGRPASARQFPGMKNRAVGHTGIETELRLETDPVLLDAISSQHRRQTDVSDQTALPGIDRKQPPPLLRRPFRTAERFKRDGIEPGNLDCCLGRTAGFHGPAERHLG